MNISYIIYRIFETKWKRKIFDSAIDELQKIPKQPVTLSEYANLQKHFDKSTELMDMIL